MAKSYNIVSTKYMFYQYPHDIDLSGSDLTSVEDASYMFSLTEGAITLGAMAPTTITNMFSSAAVTSLDLTSVDVSNVTDMGRIFSGCVDLTSLDISNWDVSNVESFYLMFNHVESLRELDLSGWTIPDEVNSDYMFSACSELAVFCSDDNISFFDAISIEYDENVVYFSSPSSFYTVTDGTLAITADFKLALDNQNPVRYRTWNGGALPALPDGVTSLNSVFSYYDTPSLDLSDWDVSQVTDFSNIFANCSYLSILEIQDWNTLNGTTFASMFLNCTALSDINIQDWKVSNVTTLNATFSGCGLVDINLGNWDVAKVTNLGAMCSECYNLSLVHLTGWDLQSLAEVSESANQMFNECNITVLTNSATAALLNGYTGGTVTWEIME